MKTLVLLRGLPGCGKSTFIKENGLLDYTLSSDAIRLMYSAPQMNIDGSVSIPQKDSEIVWKTLMQILEYRMKNGDFTVIDATNIKTTDINKFKPLAEKFRYRTYCVDMTDVPIEVVKKRNAMRDSTKIVPEFAIDRMYETLKTNRVPSWVTVIKPENFSVISFFPIDLSNWKKINIIGDVHGCYDALLETLDGGIRDNEYYIFTGDYLDRGPSNTETIKFFLDIYNRPNVFLLEGNHEIHLRKWSNDEEAVSKEFAGVTAIELEKANVGKKEVRNFCRKLCQCAYFTYNGKCFFVTHAGVSNVYNPVLISTNQMIKGVGSYKDAEAVDENFAKNNPDIIQVHGHRNRSNISVKVNDCCYNLEGAVEFGGCLRSISITEGKIETKCTPNTHVVAKKDIDDDTKEKLSSFNVDNCDVESLLRMLENNPLIQEKRFGNISSFNFSRKAFEKKEWSSQTMKARGLFIDTKAKKIIARGYEKFFKVAETEDNSLENLKNKLVFPVKVYEKENGFLGMLSSLAGAPFFATKSSINGDYCGWFKKVMYEEYGEDTVNKIAAYAEKNNCTFVFECVDVHNDPHIISYDENAAILLDVIYNENTFRKLDYGELEKLAKTLSVKVKRLATTLVSWDEFNAFCEKTTLDLLKFTKGEIDIEGYVLEDANGFMIKLKTPYYDYWKRMRSCANAILTDKTEPEGMRQLSGFSLKFTDWLKSKCNSGYSYKINDIITLRNDYFKENN